MAMVRLRTNIVLPEAKLLVVNSVVDEIEIPEHLRTEEYVDRDLEAASKGLVMLLVDVVFSERVKRSDGVKESFQKTVAGGELIRLDEIPPREREHLKEGEHYLTEWDEQERLAMQEERRFEPERNDWDRLSELRIREHR
jgi:hypothetical protein